MSKSLPVIAAVSQLVAVLIAGAAPANAQSSAVVFQGLTHTPVGAATLRVDPSRKTLDVGLLGPAGEDGVAVETPGGTSWTARVRTAVVGGLPLRMSWNALADGRRIGSGLLRQTGDQFAISAVFTGATTKATSSVQVYRDGRLVSAIGGLQPTAQTYLPIDFCRTVPEFCEFTGEFHTLADGACMIRIVSPTTAPIRLPNGTVVTGNELRLVEEVRPAGHYPYLGFDTMTMLSDARSFEILSESVR
jgi:hypothetical protein